MSAHTDGNTPVDLSVKDEGDFSLVIAYTEDGSEFVDAFMPVLEAIDSGRIAIASDVAEQLVREAEELSLSVELT